MPSLNTSIYSFPAERWARSSEINRHNDMKLLTMTPHAPMTAAAGPSNGSVQLIMANIAYRPYGQFGCILLANRPYIVFLGCPWNGLKF